MDPSGLDFLQSCVCLCDSKRPSAEVCLNHCYFRSRELPNNNNDRSSTNRAPLRKKLHSHKAAASSNYQTHDSVKIAQDQLAKEKNNPDNYTVTVETCNQSERRKPSSKARHTDDKEQPHNRQPAERNKTVCGGESSAVVKTTSKLVVMNHHQQRTYHSSDTLIR